MAHHSMREARVTTKTTNLRKVPIPQVFLTDRREKRSCVDRERGVTYSLCSGGNSCRTVSVDST